jgi:RHS repeat-associated protein
VGNLKTYNDGTTSGAYGYDDVHRKTSESVDYGSFSLGYAYDYYKNGMKKSFTGPDGVIYQYTYDDANRLASVAIPNQGSITLSSYLWNRPTAVILPGGSRREYSYDPLMRTQAITVKDPLQNAIMGYTYTYDKMDNIKGKATEHGPYAYDYDELYRLKTADNPTIPDEAFTYDPVGNRVTFAGVTGSWNYNQNNELSDYDGVSFEYDANGNATKKTAGSDVQSYSYDVENRLVRVEDGSGTVISTYYYDPFGRRLWKEVGGTRTCFLYADEGLIGEYDAAGAEIKTYGYRPGSTWTTDPLFTKQAGQYFFYQNDHLGTPQKMTNVNGGVVWSAKYESFGKAQVEAGSSVENNLRFPGQYYDQETGLHYNYHRYYDPKIGRYLRADPIGSKGGNNLYPYVNDNPIRFKDNLGLFKICTPWLDIEGQERILSSYDEWKNTGAKVLGTGPLGPTVVCNWSKLRERDVEIPVTPTRWCFDSCDRKIKKEEGVPHYKWEFRTETIDSVTTPARWFPSGDGVVFYYVCDRNNRNPLLPYPKDF